MLTSRSCGPKDARSRVLVLWHPGGASISCGHGCSVHLLAENRLYFSLSAGLARPGSTAEAKLLLSLRMAQISFILSATFTLHLGLD
jgi:hypothetical protein